MKYRIGIDLGTTNSVVYRIPFDASEDTVPELEKQTQLVAPGELAVGETLPSFLYLPDDKELPEGALNLPWRKNDLFCVGTFARSAAAKNPGKVISSAKSWLCVQTVDRNSKLLPLNRNNPERMFSPVEAASRILEQLKDSWNAVHTETDEAFEKQDIVLTVPASFDAVARELTVRAAEQAGLTVRLLEEPLAAFYCFLRENAEKWRNQLEVGDTVLVCDIGGGTSDFTLVKVQDSNGDLTFERSAVGHHILLGGDNMDLALAYFVAAKLKDERKLQLDAFQITALTHACRSAKERLLAETPSETEAITILGRGSSVIGGTIKTSLTRAELEQVLFEGFFPDCTLDSQTATAPKSALRTFSLPYESDPAVTKHLAEFLSTHCKQDTDFPTAILFNGGVTKAKEIRERILAVLSRWNKNAVRVIYGTNPDLAVAKGACAYAEVCAGKGIRVKAGSSHAYYVGVESGLPAVPGFPQPLQALCVLPFGAEEGTENEVPYDGLGLLIGEKTEFRFFASNERKEDSPGVCIDHAPDAKDIQELPSLSTCIPAEESMPVGSLIPIRLRSRLTETGTLQIECSGGNDRNWKLDFELRNTNRE